MMRRVVFLGLFLVVVLSGCQNGDQQDIEFLEDLGEDVVSLFNSKKNDLHMDLSMDRLNEVGEKVSEGQAKKLSKKNQKRMDVLEEDYTDALEMFVLEEEIEALFEEDQVLVTTFDLGDIENAEKAYEDFDLKKYNEYDARVGEQLIEAREQADQIMLVEDLFLEVFDEDGMIREDTEVDREKLATEIEKIKNPVFREDYEKWLAKLDEETVDEEPEEEDEVDEEEETASEADDDVGNFGSTNNSNNGGNNNHSNSGNSGNNSSWSGGSSSGSGQGSGGSSNNNNNSGGSSGGSNSGGNSGESENDGNSGGSGNDGNSGGSGNDGNSGGSGNDGNSGSSGNDGNSGGSGSGGSSGGSGSDGNSGGSGNGGNSGGSESGGNSGGSGSGNEGSSNDGSTEESE